MHKNKILIVPDVHGRKFWIEALSKIDMVDKVVFLGDYLDPYPYEKISFKEALAEFEAIIKFKEAFPDKVILLLGNHDLHYIYNDIESCSRYNKRAANTVRKLFTTDLNCFQLVYQIDGYVFSHAGIVKEWLEEYCHCTLDELINKPLDEIYQATEVVSRIRGGWESYGSCTWSDVTQFKNEIEGFQIFGHTQLKKDPIIDNTYACLDVRRCFLLDTEEGTILEDND